jgi:lipoprotein-anchoring transpeptidase ErfK/SrfK
MRDTILPLFVGPLIAVAWFAASVAAEPATVTPSVEFGNSSAVEQVASRLEVIVNLPERILRVYRLKPGEEIDDFTPIEHTFPVAIGTSRHPTPLIAGSVVSRQAKPSWYAPNESWAGDLAGEIIPFHSSDNPFRARNGRGGVEGYFIALGQHGVGLHSTREARSIGKLASHGCIRMKLDDVRFLFGFLPMGTPVQTAYSLFRVSETETGVAILAFEDVYHRYSAEAKVAMLAKHLGDHGIPLETLELNEVGRLLAGESLNLTDFRLISLGRRPTAATPFPTAVISNRENRVSDASELLARAVTLMPH